MRSYGMSPDLTIVRLDARDPELSYARIQVPMTSPAEFDSRTGVRGVAPWLRMDIAGNIPGVNGKPDTPDPHALGLWVFGHSQPDAPDPVRPTAYTIVPERNMGPYLERLAKDDSRLRLGVPATYADLSVKALRSTDSVMIIGRQRGYKSLLSDNDRASRLHLYLGVEVVADNPHGISLGIQDVSTNGVVIAALNPIIGSPPQQ